LAISQTLAILYDRIFLLSQSLMPAVNDLLLGFLLYQSRVVPRVLPLIAFIGAPLLLASDAAKLFDLLGPTAPLAALAAVPVAIFEFSLGVYLVVKGFRPAPILSGETPEVGVNRPFAPAPAVR
jgi:Na+/H+ antiporter NhaD/arsenite permease-like protein